MFSWLQRRLPLRTGGPASTSAGRVRDKYLSFRELLNLNTECLETIVALQEDLQFTPPRRDIVERRLATIFDKARGIVAALERLTGLHQELLAKALDGQQNEVERYIAAVEELASPRYAAWIHEIGVKDVAEAGGKAAALARSGTGWDCRFPTASS